MSDEYISIKTYFDVQSGFAFPSTSFVESGIPIVRMSDLKAGKLKFDNAKYVNKSWLDIASPFILNRGDFLLGMSGSLSNFAVVSEDDEPALLNQRVGRLKQRDINAEYEYVCYWLKSPNYARYADIQGEGAAQKNISSKQIGQFQYRNTCLEKQKKISIILNSLECTIENTEALIHKYQQIKAGLMHDLFTRGVTADGKLRPPREQAPELYQETPIGWIPKEWEVDSIGNLFHIQLGKMLSKAAKTGKWNASYLGNKNAQWDRVDLTNLEKMDFNPTEREKFKLIAGDLLVCEGGDVGRTSMWRDEMEVCFYQKAIHRLRPINEKVKPALMLRLMRHAKRTGVFTDFTSQSSIAHLTQEQLSKVKMFIPSLDEQSLMIERFDYIDNKIILETAFSEKLEVQRSGLMHDLLTGKVPVTIDQEETAHGS